MPEVARSLGTTPPSHEAGTPTMRLSWSIGVPALALIYFAAARLGLSLAIQAEQVSPVWPPTGIALAAVLLFGRRAAAGIAIGALLANLLAHEPIATAGFVAIGNTLEAVIGAWLLQRWVRFDLSLERVKHALALVVLSAGLSTTVSATIGVTSLCAGGVHPWSEFGSLWSVWWLGDATGAIVVAPAILTWAASRGAWRTGRVMEAGALSFGLVATCLIVFVATLPHIGRLSPAYAVFPFVVWAALRFGTRETVTVTLLASGVAIWGAVHGLGPFGRESSVDRLLSSQIFMSVIAITGLTLSSVVAERRRTAGVLWKQREWLRVTLFSIGDAVIVTDDVGQVSYLNPAATHLTGSGNALGTPLDRLFHLVSDPAREPLENPFVTVMREGGIVGHGRHALLVREDGTEVPVDGSGAPIRDAGGNISGVVLVFRDVAERRRSEDVVRASESRYRRLFETAQDAILILEAETGTILDANPYLLELLGYRREELIGRPVREIGLPQDHETAALRQLQEQGGVRHETLSLETRRGERIDVELVSNSYEVDQQRVIQCNLRDITERRRAEAALQASADQLAEADRRKDEFLAMLAHELRNPLAPIRNSLAILQFNGKVDPELQWTWDVVERQLRQLTRLVDDLLDVSRITRGKVQLQKETVDIADIMNRAAEEARPFIDARGLELTVTLPSPPLRLEADSMRLTQVLNNLLNNAAKYTEAGGQIALMAERQDDHAVLRVRDTGVGIAADFLPHVFELFSQQDRSLARSHGGLGVGLTLVRNLVEMHDGRVEAFSGGPGRGSEFVVRLPLPAQAVLPSRPGPPASEPPGAESGRRILIVDDSVDAAETLAVLLRRFGHEVSIAHEGPGGLEAARREAPEVALLDIGLPGMDGLEVARRIRLDSRLAHVFLIALTGYGRNEDHRRSEAAGFDAHLVKPVDLERLLNLLTRPRTTPVAGSGDLRPTS